MTLDYLHAMNGRFPYSPSKIPTVQAVCGLLRVESLPSPGHVHDLSPNRSWPYYNAISTSLLPYRCISPLIGASLNIPDKSKHPSQTRTSQTISNGPDSTAAMIWQGRTAVLARRLLAIAHLGAYGREDGCIPYGKGKMPDRFSVQTMCKQARLTQTVPLSQTVQT